MAGRFDYNEIAGRAIGEMDGRMCWPVDWVREDLPVENKEGTSLDMMMADMLNDTLKVPKTLDAFVKPANAQPVEFPKPPPGARESVLVFADSLGYAKRIMDAVPEGRVGEKKIVKAEDWMGMDQADIGALVKEQKKGWDYIIFAAGIDPPSSTHVTNVIEQDRLVTKLYYMILFEVMRNEKTKKLAVVTRGIFSESSEERKKYGMAMTMGGTLFGMTNSARQELEETLVHYIDTEYSLKATGSNDQYKIFPRIATEIFRHQTFGHNSVRILNNGRYVLRQVHSKPYEEANKEFVVPDKGKVIAISGGNGALALVMGQWLLDTAEKQGKSGFSILFLSRSMVIADLNMPAWKKIEATAERLGISVKQAKCDFSTQGPIDELVKSLSPNLAGFIHSAGVLRDSMLMNLTWEKCEEVFDSKHRPALLLHSAFERFSNPDFNFFWVFSSVAVYGNMGQINYSGSNSFLDCIARTRHGQGKPGLAIQWGAWGEVGMAATMSDSMRARTMAGPMPYFTNKQGVEGMEAGLRTGLPYFGVFIFNPPVMFGMTQGEDSVGACYQRNWTSEIVPTPIVKSIDRQHMYTAIRTTQGSYKAMPEKDWLVHKTFIAPVKEKFEEEWGDDFRKWK